MIDRAITPLEENPGNQVISNTGFESPRSTKGESCRFSPLETPSALCPPQEAGVTFNNLWEEHGAKCGIKIGDEHLIIRVDASTRIGIGHAMRCLALAQAWQDAGGCPLFVMATVVPALEDRLHSEGMEVVHLSVRPGSAEDAMETADLARQANAIWIVVDGYHFGTVFQQILKEAGLRLLFIDDYGHTDHYYSDIVLNQNIHANEELYASREPTTQLLLGTRYVLLQREFLKWRGWGRPLPEVACKVLVTMGGGDPENVTVKVLQALEEMEMKKLEAVAVVGDGNPHHKALLSTVQHSEIPIRLENHARNMPELMAWADVAVAAGGSTGWELAWMGLPSLLLILFENQRPIAEGLGREEVDINLGNQEDLSSADIARALTQLMESREIRTEMVRHGREIVDGEGVSRVLDCLKRGRSGLRLRRVQQDDCELFWKWANDPEVRAAAFNSDPVPWEEHVQWFKSKVNDPGCLILIALDDRDTPVGQVRFDLTEGIRAEIDVCVDRSKRGLGYGSNLLKLAVEEVLRVTPVREFHALVKLENEGSKKAFRNAKFIEVGREVVDGNTVQHYARFERD